MEDGWKFVDDRSTLEIFRQAIFASLSEQIFHRKQSLGASEYRFDLETFGVLDW